MKTLPLPAKYSGPQFTATKFEMKVILDIAERAHALAKKFAVSYEWQTIIMDLEACHCTGCPLDLQKLLDAPDSDFGHDIFGIRRHMDRSTGELRDCFLPRCTLPEKI